MNKSITLLEVDWLRALTAMSTFYIECDSKAYSEDDLNKLYLTIREITSQIMGEDKAIFMNKELKEYRDTFHKTGEIMLLGNK